MYFLVLSTGGQQRCQSGRLAAIAGTAMQSEGLVQGHTSAKSHAKQGEAAWAFSAGARKVAPRKKAPF